MDDDLLNLAAAFDRRKRALNYHGRVVIKLTQYDGFDALEVCRSFHHHPMTCMDIWRGWIVDVRVLCRLKCAMNRPLGQISKLHLQASPEQIVRGFIATTHLGRATEMRLGAVQAELERIWLPLGG